jgi:hypothetical protein
MTRSAPRTAALEQGRDRAPRHSVRRLDHAGLIGVSAHGMSYLEWLSSRMDSILSSENASRIVPPGVS